MVVFSVCGNAAVQLGGSDIIGPAATDESAGLDRHIRLHIRYDGDKLGYRMA